MSKYRYVFMIACAVIFIYGCGKSEATKSSLETSLIQHEEIAKSTAVEVKEIVLDTQSDQNNYNPEEVTSLEENNILGIHLSTSEVKPTGLTLICIQSDKQPGGNLQTGSWYTLEQEVNGQWISVDTVNEINGWHDDAWFINLNQKTEWVVEWEWLYGKLSPGLYRIGKEITDFRGTGDYDTYLYYAEFKIEDK